MISGKSHFVFVRMFGFSLFDLEVDMEAVTVLPLGTLDTDPAHWHLVYPDKSVSGSYYSDGDPTLDIPACLEVSLLPLGGEASGQEIQHRLCLSDHQSVDQEN